jgi:hypothetical protein
MFHVAALLREDLPTSQTMLDAFPGRLSGKMLNGLAGLNGMLRHEHFPNLRHQSMHMIARLQLGIVQDQHQKAQGTHRIALCFVKQALCERLNLIV